MQPALFDSSIYISALRAGNDAALTLRRLATKYHYERVGQGRLTNDALIATSAGRFGIRVITANERDFSKLAEFYVFPWEVTAV